MLRARAAAALALAACLGCGARTDVVRGTSEAGASAKRAEICNGLDDDGDGKVDESFRDASGNYIDAMNCGACGHACSSLPMALDVGCELVRGVPACAAASCAPGYGRAQSGGCTLLDMQLCLPCGDRNDCGALESASCVEIGGEARCSRACGHGCPSGYACVGSGAGSDHCEPVGGSCACEGASADFTLACRVSGMASACAGQARCVSGKLSACTAAAEQCNGIDDDCDGIIDEGFIDKLGAYSLSADNCGACGIRCDPGASGSSLTCGGDPFAPSCVTHCLDADNGIQVGDRLDADRRVDTGCECVVASLNDAPGAAPGTTQLDANCDGADGDVLQSFYVTVDGDDSGPGSPTRPLRTISTAVERAYASIGTATPRPHVFVATGIYTETVRVRDGVQLHGGYRGDFLAQDAAGFEAAVLAPANTSALGGAALVADHAGQTASVIEGFSFRGRDAANAGEAAIGIEIDQPGSQLALRNLTVQAGHPAAGQSGARGAAGSSGPNTASDGDPPRAALEDDMHACTQGAPNLVQGGRGAQNHCASSDVSGGDGGSAGCPLAGGTEPSGQAGRALLSSSSGIPGRGGDDMEGPITNGDGCQSYVCCGLADFRVPDPFLQATAGGPGGNGSAGSAGAACADPIGMLTAAGDAFVTSAAQDGSDGDGGGGGGGGGAGSSALLDWTAGSCEFADGLGGGGGGGGAGGCGGIGGRAGQSGGPSIGVLIRVSIASSLPDLSGIHVIAEDGARGGDGGAGGDGGLGGSGAFGGHLPDAARSTPTLAGPLPGERGGKGGDGGAGGGGGGGCGGSSIGIWLNGLGARSDLVARYQNGNRFDLGRGGDPGRGGGGAMPAASGAAGAVLEVLAR